jgi:hypothetical protein
MGGRITFPLYSVYHATKWAVEGFSEALVYELEPFGIRVKIIEPGPIRTDFYDRSLDVMTKPGLTAYDEFVARAMPALQKAGEEAPGPEVVARVIYRAATDGSRRLRYPANSAPVLLLRRLLPTGVFMGLVKRLVVKWRHRWVRDRPWQVVFLAISRDPVRFRPGDLLPRRSDLGESLGINELSSTCGACPANWSAPLGGLVPPGNRGRRGVHRRRSSALGHADRQDENPAARLGPDTDRPAEDLLPDECLHLGQMGVGFQFTPVVQVCHRRPPIHAHGEEPSRSLC